MTDGRKTHRSTVEFKLLRGGKKKKMRTSLFGKCHREEAQAGVATVTFHKAEKPFICSRVEDDKTTKNKNSGLSSPPVHFTSGLEVGRALRYSGLVLLHPALVIAPALHWFSIWFWRVAGCAANLGLGLLAPRGLRVLLRHPPATTCITIKRRRWNQYRFHICLRLFWDSSSQHRQCKCSYFGRLLLPLMLFSVFSPLFLCSHPLCPALSGGLIN